jgi:putative ABC transport system substrate-binding protein
MKRRITVLTLCAVLFALCVSAEAQQTAKIYRIGYFSSGSRVSGVDAFLQALRELGYVEGKNLIIEYRFAEGKKGTLFNLATELVNLKVDVIVAASSAAAQAVRTVNSTIPIILTDSADPVGTGLATNLARPDRNITGSSFVNTQLSGKRVEIFKEAFPKVSRLAVLTSKAEDAANVDVAARSLGIELQYLEARDAIEIKRAFSALSSKQAQGFFLMASPRFTQNRQMILDLAATSRLPAMYPHKGYTNAGGLMSYGPDHAQLQRRVAYFVDKILKGAKPADLPVEQPTKFELVINLKTAKSLGLTIPDEVLRWADEIIK